MGLGGGWTALLVSIIYSLPARGQITGGMGMRLLARGEGGMGMRLLSGGHDCPALKAGSRSVLGVLYFLAPPDVMLFPEHKCCTPEARSRWMDRGGGGE